MFFQNVGMYRVESVKALNYFTPYSVSVSYVYSVHYMVTARRSVGGGVAEGVHISKDTIGIAISSRSYIFLALELLVVLPKSTVRYRPEDQHRLGSYMSGPSLSPYFPIFTIAM
jgi:hypothetical protein